MIDLRNCSQTHDDKLSMRLDNWYAFGSSVMSTRLARCATGREGRPRLGFTARVCILRTSRPRLLWAHMPRNAGNTRSYRLIRRGLARSHLREAQSARLPLRRCVVRSCVLQFKTGRDHILRVHVASLGKLARLVLVDGCKTTTAAPGILSARFRPSALRSSVTGEEIISVFCTVQCRGVVAEIRMATIFGANVLSCFGIVNTSCNDSLHGDPSCAAAGALSAGSSIP